MDPQNEGALWDCHALVTGTAWEVRPAGGGTSSLPRATLLEGADDPWPAGSAVGEVGDSTARCDTWTVHTSVTLADHKLNVEVSGKQLSGSWDRSDSSLRFPSDGVKSSLPVPSFREEMEFL